MRRLPGSFSTQSIKDVWRASRDATASPGAPGVDGIRAGQFYSEIAANTERVRLELREGAFKFNRLRLARLPKDNGGFRSLAIPTVRDRLVQRVVLAHLEGDPKFNASSAISYGFSKRRTLQDAQRRALVLRHALPWVLKCDIVKFFDQIPRSKVRSVIDRSVRRKLAAELLRQATDCEIQAVSIDDARFLADNGIRQGIGLRQGMPVSPMLSNLLLKEFDEDLIRTGLKVVRYADDIAVFATSRRECEEALAHISELLAKLDLKVAAMDGGRKTVIVEPSGTVEFLGVEIRRHDNEVYRLHAPAKKLAQIEAAMAEAASLRRCVEERRNIGHVVRLLDAFTIGHAASMAVLEDGGAFLSRLEGLKRKTLRSLMIELIGEAAVNKLSANELAVLGVGQF